MATSIYGKYTGKDRKIMRLATYSLLNSVQERTAFILDDDVFDLNESSKYYNQNFGDQETRNESYSKAHAPTDMHSLIEGGDHVMDHLVEVFNHLSALNSAEVDKIKKNEKFLYSLKDVKIKAPLRPKKIIHTAGNFREHANEGSAAGWPFPIPEWISFLKNPYSVIGHDSFIEKPDFTNKLDHELELAIIIGKKMKNVEEEEAKKRIFGFTVFNDVTARDIQKEEMKNGLLNFGKNLDTFAPLGPVLVPYRYFKDPHNLTMELRVNGDPRQQGSTAKLSVKIEKIVSKYSWVTLNQGDMISTGTISGVAAFRKPDPTPYFLKDKDVLECEIEGIGMMRNTVKNA